MNPVKQTKSYRPISLNKNHRKVVLKWASIILVKKILQACNIKKQLQKMIPKPVEKKNPTIRNSNLDT